MVRENTSKRWYDLDPTVSLAISILRNTTPKNQKLVADFIIEKSKVYNIVLKAPVKKFSLFSRRWYDSEEKLIKSLEYLRVAEVDIQKKLAVDIINYLYNLEEAGN